MVTADRRMAGAAGAGSPEMVRTFTMGLAVRQGRVGGHRPLRPAAWPGNHDVQPSLTVPMTRSRPGRSTASLRPGELDRQQYAQPLPVVDALIAATARIHGLTVITRNVKGFELSGVPVLNPFAD